MISTYLEQAIKSIEAERDQRVAVAKERVNRERIAPFNAEIDNYRAKALTEVDNELNQKIVALKQEYEAKKRDLIALGEEKKRANAESVYSSELASITVEYDVVLSKLSAQIADIKD